MGNYASYSNGYSFGITTDMRDYLSRVALFTNPNRVDDFKPGDEIEVTITGKVMDGAVDYDTSFEYVGHAYTPAGGKTVLLDNRKVTALRVTKAAKQPPKWQAGDVITVKFDPRGTVYTYVRGAKDWPGDTTRLSDARVNELYRDGKVQHRMRGGQYNIVAG